MYAIVKTHWIVLLKREQFICSVRFTVYKLYPRQKRKVTTSNLVQIELISQHWIYFKVSLWPAEPLFIWNLVVSFREGNGNPLQYSCLENPMDGGAWWAAVHGVAKSRAQLSNFTFTFHFHALEKEMATHSSVFAWRITGTEEPSGLPSMGSHRVEHDWSDLAAAAATVSFIN